MDLQFRLKEVMEEHLKTRFEWEEIQYNEFRIITPFLDKRNDNIEIYLRYKSDDDISISDKSYTIEDLKSENINIDSSILNKLFEGILIQHTVNRKENELTKKTNISKLGIRATSFIQCILKLNDFYLINKWNDLLNSKIIRINNKKENTSLFINKSIKIENNNITVNTRVIVLNTKRNKFKNSLKQFISQTEDEMMKYIVDNILHHENQASRSGEIEYINNFGLKKPHS